MKKPLKILLIVIISLVIGLLLTHLIVNNLIPFIQSMHSGMY
jgi:hypothetical protein